MQFYLISPLAVIEISHDFVLKLGSGIKKPGWAVAAACNSSMAEELAKRFAERVIEPRRMHCAECGKTHENVLHQDIGTDELAAMRRRRNR